MKTYFLPHGRLSRGAFIEQIFIFLTIEFLLMIVCSQLPETLGVALYLASLVVYVYVSAMAQVKRLHDIGRSGRQFFLLLVPIYQVFLLGCLFFQKGIAGESSSAV